MTTNVITTNKQNFNQFNQLSLTAKEQHQVKGGSGAANEGTEFIIVEEQVDI